MCTGSKITNIAPQCYHIKRVFVKKVVEESKAEMLVGQTACVQQTYFHDLAIKHVRKGSISIMYVPCVPCTCRKSSSVPATTW